MKRHFRMVLIAALLLGLILAGGLMTAQSAPGGGGGSVLTVSGTPWGITSMYTGACEGDVDFNVNDMLDLGINVYRMWWGMGRLEWQDDDGVYGSPTIAEIKANPDIINWAWWDNAFTVRPAYAWEEGIWQGTTAQQLQGLQANNILPVVTLRPYHKSSQAAWAIPLCPPDTVEDQNEWWEHVFATIYWCNVRNNYGVDDWQVHNEPDNGGQGWAGTEAQYYQFVQLTYDAIKYVYDTYLPGRPFRVYAPVSTSSDSWVAGCLQQAGPYFNVLDTHAYSSTWSADAQEANGYIQQYGGGRHYDLFFSEWGSWHQNQYNTVNFVTTSLMPNLIKGCYNDNNHVWGSCIFGLYDWKKGVYGLLDVETGYKREGYWGMRMACRAIQGGRTTYQTASTNGDLLCITTRDAAGRYYVLINNKGRTVTATVDLSALLYSGTGTMWEYSAANKDVIVGSPVLSAGKVTITIPNGAVLLKF
ncbi:MAG: hypothetical protein ACM3X6_11400 [Patescibacteria group bacterium]